MKKIGLLILYLFFLSITITFAQKTDKNFINGEIYIKIKKEIPFKSDTLHSTIDISSKLPFLFPLVEKYKITKAEASFYFSKSDKLQRTFRIHFNKAELIDLLLEEMKKLNQIEYAEKVPLMHVDYIPNDIQADDYSGQYALYNIRARSAWDVSRGDFTTKVAIVDNAINIDHEDLSSNVFNMWDVSDNDNNPRPPNAGDNRWWHGTHTSGIACAITDNNIGIASIGFNNSLIAIKATSNSTSNPKSIDHGYEGIAWASSHGANVISCSWGTVVFSQTGQNTVNDAFNVNAIVVASAGNNNSNVIQYPAGYDHVVAVASVDQTDTKASDSNFGNWVDIAAPGVSIYSTIPVSPWYGLMSGTSMAAPLVAGLCGLVRSVNPSMSYDAVVNDVVSTADNIDAKNPGFAGQLGSGRINAYWAVENALPCNPSINLGSNVYSVPKTESSGSITSANLLADVQVLFDAKTLVDLVPGFFVANGRTFHAYIDGCGGNLRLPQYANSKKGSGISNEVIETPAIIISEHSLQVYPNPASNVVQVQLSGYSGKVMLQLTELYGKVLKQTSVQQRANVNLLQHQFSVVDLAAGTYFLIATDEKGNKQSVKVMVLH